jgi:hypothetical protein
MYRCGVAAPPIFHRKLSVAWLASTIRRLQSDEGLRAASRALGTELAKERRIEKAVNAIQASIAAM